MERAVSARLSSQLPELYVIFKTDNDSRGQDSRATFSDGGQGCDLCSAQRALHRIRKDSDSEHLFIENVRTYSIRK